MVKQKQELADLIVSFLAISTLLLIGYSIFQLLLFNIAVQKKNNPNSSIMQKFYIFLTAVFMLLSTGYAHNSNLFQDENPPSSRGNDLTMIYATQTQDVSDPGVYKTTLGKPGEGTLLTSNMRNYQCMESLSSYRQMRYPGQ